MSLIPARAARALFHQLGQFQLRDQSSFSSLNIRRIVGISGVPSLPSKRALEIRVKIEVHGDLTGHQTLRLELRAQSHIDGQTVDRIGTCYPRRIDRSRTPERARFPRQPEPTRNQRSGNLR